VAGFAEQRQLESRFVTAEGVKRAKLGQRFPVPANNDKHRSTSHSRAKESLVKQAVAGAIRGGGKFVLIAASEAGTISIFATHAEGMELEFSSTELQSWMRSRFIVEPARHVQCLRTVHCTRPCRHPGHCRLPAAAPALAQQQRAQQQFVY
jgi:hypothetical protein